MSDKERITELEKQINLNNDIYLQNQIISEERIGDLEYVLGQLKSQLLDTHAEDSLLIQIITNILKK